MKRIAFSLIFAGVFIALGPVSVSAVELLDGIKGSDDRLIMESAEYPWSAVGRVHTEIKGSHCSGVLVGPALVITASHCLYDKRNRWFVPVDRVHFVAGYAGVQDGEYVAHSKAAGYFIPSAYEGGVQSSTGNAGHDWAFIELKEEIGLVSGWFGVMNFDQAAMKLHDQWQTPFVQSGYSRDKKKLLTAHIGCDIESYQGNLKLLVHKCDAVPGDSGSPMYLFKSGLPYLLGIHVATTKETRLVRGVAVPTSTFVQGVLEKGAGNPGMPNSGTLLPNETTRTFLATMGYTGGGKLEDAIRRFQADEGLTVTGEVSYDLVGYLIVAMVREP